MTFTRYFDSDISKWIDTPEQRDLVAHIRGLDVDALGAFKDDLITDADIDPTVKKTNTFKMACNTVIRRCQYFRKAGIKPTVHVGPPLTIGSMCWAAIQGIVIGDIAADVIIAHGNKASEEAAIRRIQLQQ